MPGLRGTTGPGERVVRERTKVCVPFVGTQSRKSEMGYSIPRGTGSEQNPWGTGSEIRVGLLGTGSEVREEPSSTGLEIRTGVQDSLGVTWSESELG